MRKAQRSGDGTDVSQRGRAGKNRVGRKCKARTRRLALETLEDRRLLSVDLFPTPLEQLQPLGGLLYQTSVDAAIESAGEIDSFSVDLDGAQSLTVVVDAGEELAPSIELTGPDASSLGSSAAVAGGADAVLQTVAAVGPGTYTVNVTGGSDTTGSYTATLILNADVEMEEHGGAANDDASSAQDLGSSFLGLGLGPAERGAVLGAVAAAGGGGSDWFRFTLEDGQSTTLALTGLDTALVGLELYDTGPQLLATALGTVNAHQLIDGFVDPTTDGAADTYFARVTGNDTAYSLVVTRNADFDAELNNGVAPGAQDITHQGTVLGGLVDATTVPPASISSTIPLPRDIFDGDDFNWGIFTDGRIVRDPNGAYHRGMVHLGFPEFSVGQVEDANRETVIGPAVIGEVQVTRKIYVPDDKGFARFLEIVTNTSDASANYTVAISSSLGSDRDTETIGTSSGDVLFDVQDDWLVTDDRDEGGDPTLLHVIAGPGGRRPASASLTSFDQINHTYDLTLAPGETQIVMHFASQNTNRSTAWAKGPLLADLKFGALAGMSEAELAQTVNFDIDVSDYYSVQVLQGDQLIAETAVPSSGPFEFVNEGQPALELYDPHGALVASGAGGALTHTAAENGTYSVRVHEGQAFAGEYVLSLGGYSGSLPPFQVLSTAPHDGARFPTSPVEIRIELSDQVLMTSVQPSDLRVNGVQASDATVVDADTLAFSLPALTEGINSVTIAAGNLVDLQGQPIEAFEMELVLDTTPPRVVGTSIQEGDVAPAGTLVYTAQFDEELSSEHLDAGDVDLFGQETGDQIPSVFNYDPATSTLMVQYDDLPEDDYILRLDSLDHRFEDLVGWNLDGEPLAFPIPPNRSGDGVAGGSFVVRFTADYMTTPFPGPLELKLPVGSLIYDTQIEGKIDPAGDTDRFTIDVDDGQTITVWAETGESLRATVELIDPSSAVLATTTADAPGRPAVIQSVPTTGPGTYTVSVTGTSGTQGTYRVGVVLNAGLELEEYGGRPNDLAGFAQDLDPSFAPLGTGPGDRGAVLGAVSDESGVAEDWYRFTLDDGDSATLALTGQNPAALGLLLYDAASNPLAGGTPAANVNDVINEFVDATSDGEPDTYFARVFGDEAEYSLVVMRNADFDSEPHDIIVPTARDITLNGSVLGGLPSRTSPSRRPPLGAPSVPTVLIDGEGFQWDIRESGRIFPGIDGAYDSGLFHDHFRGSTSGNLEGGGREIVIGPRAIDDVEVIRKVYVPEHHGYVRFLEMVTNTSSRTETYSVEIFSDLGSDQDTQIVATSTGDPDFDLNDDWYVTDDSFSGSRHPTLLHVVSGANGMQPTHARFFEDDRVVVGYDLSLAPGETQIVMHFAAKNADHETALQKGPLLAELGLGALAGMTDAERVQTVNFELGIADDYSVDVQEGDVLSISTSLPAGGPFEFDNSLDIGVELYDPAGSLVGSSSGETFHHTALQDGTYNVRVLGNEETAGEYLLNVSGHTGGLPPFEVTDTDPVDGSRFRFSPDMLQIQFSDHVLLSSAEGSDLLVDGTPALDVNVLDGDTLKFTLPELVEGTNRISIASGALLDLQRQPVSPFEMELIVDTTAPRVVNSSIQQDDTVPTGRLVYVAEFDEPLLAADLDATDVVLAGEQTGPHAPTSFHYDPAASAVTIEYAGLVEDDFTLTLLSGSGAFEDLLGFGLDGEPLAFPIPPNTSGDGSPGGDFVVEFATDFVAHPFPVPLEAKQPLGSLVYDSQVDGHIDPAGDFDRFTIDVDDGQTVSVLVQAEGSLRPGIELIDPASRVIGSVVAPDWGEAAILQTIPTTGAGTYTIEVRGVSGTRGSYVARLLLNAAVEFEAHNGASNDGIALSEDLDASFVSLGFGTAERGAVIGSGAFGQGVNLGAGVNTAGQELNPTLSADRLTFVFNSDRAGGQGGQDLYMATRGSLLDPFGNVTNLGAAVNTSGTEVAPALSADGLSLYFASIRPGSEGLDIYLATRATTSDPFGDVVQLDSPVNTVHHDSAPAISGDGLSLYFTSNRPGFGGNDIYVATRLRISEPFVQATNVGEGINSSSGDTRPEISSDGLSLFFTSNRPGGLGGDDTYVARRETLLAEFGPPINLGPHVNTAAAERGPTLSFDENLLLFDSDRMGGHGASDLYIATREDWYRFTLDDGASASVAVQGVATSDIRIELYDNGGTLLAGGPSGDGPSQEVLDFIDTTGNAAADTYHVRVIGNSPDYTLIVTRDATWDSEPNPGVGPAAQDITLTGTVLGHVGAIKEGGRLFVYDAALHEIQELDAQTGRKIHRFPSPVSAAAGPDFGMASTPTTLLAGGSASEDIFELDPDTGAVLRRIPNPGVTISGMAFLEGRIFLLTDAPRNLQTILDYDTGAVIGQVEPESLFEAMAATSHFLLGVDGTNLYRVEQFSGRTSFLGVCGGGINFTDAMGVIGDELFIGDSTKINVYELGPLNLVRTLPGLVNVEAIAADGQGAGGVDGDVYRVEAKAGDTLSVQTRIPAAGPLEFINMLDVGVELYHPSGALVAASPSGSLVHEAEETGPYSVRVFAENGTAGEYVLNVSGHSVSLPPFEVTASDPADGDSFSTAISTLRVDLSGQLLSSSVESADLLVNGSAATGVTIVDSDTVEFTLPPLADGANQLSIAAGAIVSLTNQPLEAFAIEVSLDNVAPRVVSTSIQAGDTVVAGVPLTVTIEFDEPMDDFLRTSAGLLGEYYIPGGEVHDFPDFDALVPVHRRIDPIIYFPREEEDFGGFPDLDEHFAVRWRGQILIEETGTVDFSVLNSLIGNEDNHARLYVDEQLVADTTTGPIPGRGSIHLTAGLHDIRLEYYSAANNSQMLFRYRSVSGLWRIVPDSVLLRSSVTLNSRATGNPSAPALSLTPTATRYDPVNSVLTLDYAPLPEGLFQLTVHSDLGAVADRAGNALDGEPSQFPLPPNVSGDGSAGGNFVVDFAAEIDIIPFPVPLDPKLPLGSLIYDSVAEGIVNSVNDTDRFTIDLDKDQTLTLLVSSEPSLRSTVEIRGLDDMVLASSTAALAGERVLLQTEPIAHPGTYTIGVRGEDGTFGGYRVRAVLNAALEEEENGGPANNHPFAAQDLDSGFTSLGFDSAQRAAVLGSLLPILPSRVVIREDFESGLDADAWSTRSTLPEGRIRVTGDHGVAAGSFALIMDRDPEGPPNLNEAVWKVDVSGIVEPSLSFFHVDFNDEIDALPQSFSGSVNGDGVAISDNGIDWYTILNAVSEPSGSFEQVSYDLGETGAAAGMALDGEFFVKFQQWGGEPVPSDGRGVDEITITTPESLHEDWYRATLADGESMSLVLTSVKARGVELELYDDVMTLIDTGVAAGAVDRLIRNFTDTTTDGTRDTYFVRVVGSDTDYSLMVARNADFDPGWARSPGGAIQDITSTGTAFGYLGERVLEDFEEGNLDQYMEIRDTTDFSTARPAAHEGKLGLRSSRSTLGWIVRTDERVLLQQGDRFSVWVNVGDRESAVRFLFGTSETAHLGVSLQGHQSFGLFEQNGLGFTGLGEVQQPLQFYHWYQLEVDWAVGGRITAKLYESDGSTLLNSISATAPTIRSGGIGFQSFRFDTYFDTVELLDGPGVQEATYAVAVQAGDLLAVRTALPAGGPGAFDNSLDPQLTVFDPSGTPIATDTDSLDGRNARVNLRAAESGVYRIQISTESGRGEYVVDVDTLVAGDMNGDGVVDIDDTGPFVMALVDRAAYEAAFGLVAHMMGDMDGDGDLDVDDVGAFRALLTGGGGSTASTASLAADPVTAPASAAPLPVGWVSNPSQVGWVSNPSPLVGWVSNPSQVGWVFNPSRWAARSSTAATRRDGLESHPTNDLANSDTVAQVARGIVATDREARRRVGFARSHMGTAGPDRATEPSGRSHGVPDGLLDRVWQEEGDWRHDDELG